MEEKYAHAYSLLTDNGIRPTKIRKAIAALLFDSVNKHVTVDDIIDMARVAGIKTSVASVYNTLNLFVATGLLNRVTVEQGRAFFDTNLSDHHHFYYEDENRLEDIADGTITVSGIPDLPEGKSIKSVDVTICL